jgi:hypothetical protein
MSTDVKDNWDVIFSLSETQKNEVIEKINYVEKLKNEIKRQEHELTELMKKYARALQYVDDNFKG